MKDLREIIASNISTLRTEEGLTQARLAEALNYSDKAVSKWERGEALPDIIVLKAIADYFGVSVDYLLTDGHREGEYTPRAVIKQRNMRRGVICAISVALVWLVSLLAFATLCLVGMSSSAYLVFLYALPLSFVLLLIFNCVWGRRRYNYFIVSALMWTVVLSVYLTCLFLGRNPWIIFVAAAPFEIIFLFLPGISLIKYSADKEKKNEG